MVRLNEILDKKEEIDNLVKHCLEIDGGRPKRGQFTVHDDYSVTIKGDCKFIHKTDRFPFTFFDIRGYFDCENLGLTSLEGGPITVSRPFFCDSNKLTSLIGSPKSIGGNFFCKHNPLITLEGLSKFIAAIDLSWNPDLPLLRLVGLSSTQLFNYTYDLHHTTKILEKYKDDRSRANILACQKELINAGFEGNASW